MEYTGVIIKISLVIFMLMNITAVSGFLERRIVAFIQDRLGPNRVGPFGLFQPLADVIKFAFKEDFIPEKANKTLFKIAPLLAFIPSFIIFAVIPFGNMSWGGDFAETTWAGASGNLAIADVGVGVLFFLAVSSLTAYGLAYGGWASNNKYSLLGGLRSSAQIISFEIAMGLALVSVLMSAGSVDLNEIVIDQKGTFLGFLPNWLCFRQPLVFLLFFITAFAETNRLPFDLAEAEPELVGGFHTEYSGLRWSVFIVGEYIAMVSISGVMVTLFLGGWYLPGMEALFPVETTSSIVIAFVSITIFLGKVMALMLFFMWVRWTLPRFRWDQLMKLGWKTLIPLALLNIILTAVLSL